MTLTERRQRFRAILAGNRCVHPASVFDPISARIAQDIGFDVMMFAGSIASFTVLGAPDLAVLTLTEFADQIRRITRAGTLPLLVDADHGYGNALNVMRTVEELETAGVAALTIEDTLLPAAFGAGDKPQMISLEEGVGKMRAALAARTDPNLVIIGRSSAPALSNVDDAIARTNAYAKAGVDAMFFGGVKSRDQIEAIAKATKIPLVLGGNGTPGVTEADYLITQGIKVCLTGHQPFSAAVLAVQATLKALYSGTAPTELANIAPSSLMKTVTREADYARWGKDYLGG